MRKRIGWAVLTVVLLSSCAGNKTMETSYAQETVETLALKTFLSNKKEQQLTTAAWDYVPGLVAQSVLKAWELYPEKVEYYNAVKEYADHCLQGGDTIHIEDSNLDELQAGKMFFTLYKAEMEKGNEADAARYKNCATFLRNKLKYTHARISDDKPGAGGFFHKPRYPDQMWLDGLFVGGAVYAEWQANFGADGDATENTESWTDIAFQFKTLHKQTFDVDKELNYHAWSANPTDPSSFWAMREGKYAGCSPEFWGRASGWYFVALADVLDMMPKNHADYNDQ